MEDRFLLIALKQIPQIGDVQARKILSLVSLKDLFFKPENWVKKSSGLSPRLAKRIVDSRSEALHIMENEIKQLEKYHIGYLTILDEDYPYRLKNCEDAPIFFFYQGNLEALKIAYQLAVVGTRKISTYGKKATEELISSLSLLPVCIISGLATGVDTVAHEEALKNSLKTIAVLGHGFAYTYPSTNKLLAERIVENGLLITEYLFHEAPDKGNFPQRNRIIAGLADAVVVVESGRKGGALITAELAFNYDRDVFAFPGRVFDEKSQGCNWLIKTQRAQLIESAEDLVEAMQWNGKAKLPPRQTPLPITQLSPEAQQVLDFIIHHQPCMLDDLYKNIPLPPPELAAILLDLEFEGCIKSLPGKQYVIS